MISYSKDVTYFVCYIFAAHKSNYVYIFLKLINQFASHLSTACNPQDYRFFFFSLLLKKKKMETLRKTTKYCFSILSKSQVVKLKTQNLK